MNAALRVGLPRLKVVGVLGAAALGSASLICFMMNKFTAQRIMVIMLNSSVMVAMAMQTDSATVTDPDVVQLAV